MDWGLKGKTALVTGASQGIGRTTAKLLALEGVTVFGVARRGALVEALNAEISLDYPNAAQVIPFSADFSMDGEPERVAAEALRTMGRVDILMNAAGGSRPIDFDATKE